MVANPVSPSVTYDAHRKGRLLEEYAPAVPLGATFNLALAAFSLHAGDPRAASVLLAIGAAFAASYPLARTQGIQRHPELAVLVIGMLCAIGAATLSVVGPGFAAAGWSILVVCWGLGATQLSLKVPVLAAGIGLQLAVFLVITGSRGALDGTTSLFGVALVVCAAALAVFGARERHRRQKTLFTQERLLRDREEALRREEKTLSARRAQLERLARRQVEDLLAGARTVGALESLLAERVRGRSRHLAARVDQAFSVAPAARHGPTGEEPAA